MNRPLDGVQMSPFQGLRFWLRNAPAGQRALAGVACILTFALVAWGLTPDRGDDETATGVAQVGSVGAAGSEGGEGAGLDPGAPAIVAGDTAGAPAAGAGAAAGDGGGPGAGGPEAAASGGAGAAGGVPAGGAAAPTCPGGSGDGLTDTTVKIGFGITNIAGPIGNSAVGVPTPEEQQRGFQTLVDHYNGLGGVGCRKIEPTYFQLNPADQEGLAAACRDIDESGVFAFVDSGAYVTYPAIECFGQRKIPYLGGYFGLAERNDRLYPYLFALNQFESTIRNAVLVLKQQGYFDPANGFRKLAFPYLDCFPTTVAAFRQAIEDVGVPSSAISEFSYGCPAVPAIPPTVHRQAALQFQRDGVTHIYPFLAQNAFDLSKQLQQQGVDAQWIMEDSGIVSVSYGTNQPDYDNFDGAIAISTNRGGEERTAGQSPSPGTVACDAIYRAAGMGTTWELPALFGNACNQFQMLAAGMGNVSEIRAETLAAGIQAQGRFAFSFPQADADFSAPRTTTGGQSYRTVVYLKSCRCWQVKGDPTFKPILR